jgi:hypothetical protein
LGVDLLPSLEELERGAPWLEPPLDWVSGFGFGAGFGFGGVAGFGLVVVFVRESLFVPEFPLPFVP